MKRAALLPLLPLLLVAACGGEPPPPPPPAVPAYETRPVVAEAIAALAAEVVDEPLPAPPEDLDDLLLGLVTFHAGSAGELREAANDDVRALGPVAAAPLADLAREADRPVAERTSALSLLAVLRGPHVGATWMDLAEDAEVEPWVRSRAYFELGASTAQPWLQPRLARRLKYEKDHEAFVWLAAGLARQRNFSGVERLVLVWAEDADEAVRALAEQRLVEMLANVEGVENAGEVRDRWNAGDADGVLPTPELDARFELEVWRWIDRLDEFQLRGVDDARYLLSRQVGAVGALLGEALRDERFKVRVHVAQTLERMGPRGRLAVSALEACLDDPEAGSAAAAALGAIGEPDAGAALAARLAPHRALALRVACARALGALGDAARADALAPWAAEGTAADLRQAAAEALARLGRGDAVAEHLLACVEDPFAEARSAEEALRAWLAGKGDSAADVLAQWDAISAGPDGSFPTVEETRAASAERVALVRAHLAALVGG